MESCWRWSPPHGQQQDYTPGAPSYLPCPRGNQTHRSRTLVVPLTLPSRTRIRKSQLCGHQSGTTDSGRCHPHCCLLKFHWPSRLRSKATPSLKLLWSSLSQRGHHLLELAQHFPCSPQRSKIMRSRKETDFMHFCVFIILSTQCRILFLQPHD